MKEHPKMANPGPLPDDVLDSMIEVATAYTRGTAPSEPEAVFYLFATPALLKELRAHRRAARGGDGRNGAFSNVVSIADHAPVRHLATPEGAA